MSNNASIALSPADTIVGLRAYRRGVGLVALASLVGFLLIGVATRNGVGLSVDSAFYIGVANELSAGNGLRVPWGTAEPTPLGTRWGPLMPAFLATVSQFVGDPMQAARWVNATCLSLTSFICGLAILESTGSIGLSLFVTLLLATSQSMLSIFSMAWSEPIFIVLATLAMVLLATHFQTKRRFAILAAVFVIIAACVTRYAGASLIAAAFGCFLLRPGRWTARFIAAACIVLLSLLPMTPGGPNWLSWMVIHLGGMTEDSNRAALLDVLRVNEGLDVLTNWLWPWGLNAYRPRSPAAQLIPVSLLLVALAASSWATWRALRKSKAASTDSPLHPTRAMPSPHSGGVELGFVMTVFVGAYLLLIIAAVGLFGRTVSFNERIMLPLMPIALMLLAVGWNTLRPRNSRRMAMVLATVCTLVVGVRMAGALDYCNYIATGHGAGAQNYQHPSWRTSPTIAEIRNLPKDATIYSNAPDAIYLLTGRNAIWLSLLEDAKPFDPATIASKPNSPHPNHACIAYFDRLAWRPSSPARRDIIARWPVMTVAATKDGAIYSFTEAVSCSAIPE
ncbi:hypothetical protein B7486_16245 [cyanobacterium TDX16]|nr:hypothetical protein B7486_16245 [cyanobacterium TDX16]